MPEAQVRQHRIHLFRRQQLLGAAQIRCRENFKVILQHPPERLPGVFLVVNDK